MSFSGGKGIGILRGHVEGGQCNVILKYKESTYFSQHADNAATTAEAVSYSLNMASASSWSVSDPIYKEL